MVVRTAPNAYTPDDLLRMPDGDRYELVNGELVERDMGAESGFVAGEIYGSIREHCRKGGAGLAFPEGTSYQCFPDDPNEVRRADASFIRLGRLADDHPPTGHIRIAPDIAVEVVSPNDTAYEVSVKTQEWLAAGVPFVWIVNPRTRIVTVYRADGSVSDLHESDELTGEQVLPGFRCRVSDVFAGIRRPAPAT